MGRLDGHLDYRPLASVRIEQATRDGIAVGIAEHTSVTREERRAGGVPAHIQRRRSAKCENKSLKSVKDWGSCFIF